MTNPADDIANADIRRARTALAVMSAPAGQLGTDAHDTLLRNAAEIRRFLDRLEGQRLAERRRQGDFTPELVTLEAQAGELRALSSELGNVAFEVTAQRSGMSRNGHDASDAMQVQEYGRTVELLIGKLTVVRDTLSALGSAFGEPAA